MKNIYKFKKYKTASIETYKYTALLIFIFLLLIRFLRFTFSPDWFNNNLGGFDWDQHFFYLESIRKPVAEYGQFPLWNPYYVGGMPILENPQIKFFTPTFLFSILFGSIIGLKISVLFYYALGALGCIYLFYNCLKFSFSVSFFSSSLLLFSGFLPQHIFAGHSNFFTIPLIPWIYAFLYKYFTQDKIPFLLFASLSAAWLISEGNAYFYLYLNLTAFLFFLYFTAFKQYHFALKTIYFVIFSLLLSSYRLLPELEYLYQYGAYFRKDQNVLSLLDIWKLFTSHSQHPQMAKNFIDQEHNWWEYGNYISMIPFFLFLGLIPFLKKRDFGYVILLIVLTLLMSGDFHSLSPAHLLSYFPGYGNLRAHARWSYIFVLFFSILLGILLTRLNSLLREKNIKLYNIRMENLFSIMVISMTVFLYYDLSKKNSPVLKGIFSIPIENVKNSKKGEFQTVSQFPDYGSASSMMTGILSNKSTKNGYENLLTKMNVHHTEESNYRGEFYLLSGKKIEPAYWSPGKMKFSIESDKNDRLVINQNYNPYWYNSENRPVEVWKDKLSIRIVPGKNLFNLYYCSPYFLIGSMISIFSLLFFLLYSLKIAVSRGLK